MAAQTIFTGEDTVVPEGTSHEYACRFVEASGAVLELAAITSIALWLDDVRTGTAINSRTNVDVLDDNGGTLEDDADGALFTMSFDPADAVIVTQPPSGPPVPPRVEQHRITLKVGYNKTGGGTGQLTHEVLYRVRSFPRI